MHYALSLLLSLLFAAQAPNELDTNDCAITSLSVTERLPCDNQGTNDWEDDYFPADIELAYENRPSTGFLELSGPLLIEPVSVPVDELPIASGSYRFRSVLIQATAREQTISLTAAFTALPSCTFTNPRPGRSREQCSVCPGPRGTTGQPYPRCWPVQQPGQPCSQSVNYSPDPNYPELTPLRYMQTIIHIFQKEDPEQLDQWVRHPTDPGNFTEEHLGIIASWFEDPEGANGLLANLCDDPTDGSPHIPDARLRLLNTGTVGKDIFFHPDNKGWGIGYSGCKPGGYAYWYQVKNKYITKPSPEHPDYLALSSPETQQAFHVFITGGKWQSEPPGDPRIPDDDDCYWPCGGGLTSSMGCSGDRPPDYPSVAIFGTYNIWQHGNTPGEQTCEVDYPGSDAGLGRNMLGEIFHVLSLDHPSPLQAHKKHPDGGDGCADTPLRSDYNLLDCSFQTRCALTQCQVGRIHHFFAEQRPSFERFPDGQGGFTAQRPDCAAVAPDLVIPPGADIAWVGVRELSGGVTVSSGARLSISCELGLPGGAGILVEPGGELIIDGARLYTPCGTAPWKGLQVQGSLDIRPGTVLEDAEMVQLEQGGQASVSQARFIRSGLSPEGIFCGGSNFCDL